MLINGFADKEVAFLRKTLPSFFEECQSSHDVQNASAVKDQRAQAREAQFTSVAMIQSSSWSYAREQLWSVVHFVRIFRGSNRYSQKAQRARSVLKKKL